MSIRTRLKNLFLKEKELLVRVTVFKNGEQLFVKGTRHYEMKTEDGEPYTAIEIILE